MNERRARITDEDRAIGQRLRKYRLLRGLTQKQLSTLIGESAKRVFYFENAQCRIGGRLILELSRALRIPMSWLCSEVDEGEIVHFSGMEDDEAPALQRFLNTAEGFDLNHHFRRIGSVRKREMILMLVNTIVDEQGT